MKTKFGAIIVDGRGKIGGHVASKNRAGTYLRTKVTPANAQTSFQTAVRNRFTEFSQGWRALTQNQRDAWNAAVINFARTDIFGDIRNPSGLNLYQRLNNVLASVAEASIDIPPLPSAVENVVLSAITATVGAPTMTAVFAPTVPANTAVKVFATPPMSAGKSYVKSDYRQIDTLAAATVSGENILAAYTAKFGSLGEIGQKIFVKFVPVNITTGQEGSPTVASVITVA
jgi:hypothetical protein